MKIDKCIWCSKKVELDDWGMCKTCSDEEDNKKSEEQKKEIVTNFVNKLPKSNYGNLGQGVKEIEVEENGKIIKVDTLSYHRHKIVNVKTNEVMNHRNLPCLYRSKGVAKSELYQMSKIHGDTIEMEIRRINE